MNIETKIYRAWRYYSEKTKTCIDYFIGTVRSSLAGKHRNRRFQQRISGATLKLYIQCCYDRILDCNICIARNSVSQIVTGRITWESAKENSQFRKY